MTDSSSGGESRTEQPTPRRLEKAREEGSVLRAPGIGAAAILLAGAAAIGLGGAELVRLLGVSLHRGLSVDPAIVLDPARLMPAAGQIVAPGLEVIVPFLTLMAVIGFVADLMIGGWVFSSRPLTPDWTRLDPLRGLRRLFSRTALVETVKALAKFAVTAVSAAWLLRDWSPAFLQLGAETWPRAVQDATQLWIRIFLVLAACILGLAVLEVPYQLWAHRDRLRMTRQDIRDEMRELDGSPQTKRRIRLIRRRAARMRMAMEVPKADAVITNPEHYAAALSYHEGKMRAPRLVAKGTGLVALRIREIAAAHAVPIIEAPRLARAICRFVELEDEIPTGLYAAAAEVLAYVYRLRAARVSGRPAPPLPPGERLDPPPDFAA